MPERPVNRIKGTPVTFSAIIRTCSYRRGTTWDPEALHVLIVGLPEALPELLSPGAASRVYLEKVLDIAYRSKAPQGLLHSARVVSNGKHRVGHSVHRLRACADIRAASCGFGPWPNWGMEFKRRRYELGLGSTGLEYPTWPEIRLYWIQIYCYINCPGGLRPPQLLRSARPNFTAAFPTLASVRLLSCAKLAAISCMLDCRQDEAPVHAHNPGFGNNLL